MSQKRTVRMLLQILILQGGDDMLVGLDAKPQTIEGEMQDMGKDLRVRLVPDVSRESRGS